MTSATVSVFNKTMLRSAVQLGEFQAVPSLFHSREWWTNHALKVPMGTESLTFGRDLEQLVGSCYCRQRAAARAFPLGLTHLHLLWISGNT